MTISFTGAAAPLTPAGLRIAAAKINVPARALRAVIAVETDGHGFDKRGRLRMLFEPVQFYRRANPHARMSGLTLGIAKTSSKGWRYPVDSYPSLDAAYRLDPAAALLSCSWGLGQVMGFNHAAAGFDSPEAMIAAFVASEDAHVLGMAMFIKDAKLDAALRTESWAKFAAGYNGPGYKANDYDTKLSKAYAAIHEDELPLSVAAAAVAQPVLALADAPTRLLAPSPVVPPAVPGKTGQGPAPSIWQRVAHALNLGAAA